MRLFTRAQTAFLIKLDEGFEGLTGSEADEDPDDGWLIGGSDPHKWHDFAVLTGRTGSKGLAQYRQPAPYNDTTFYRTFPTGKELLIEYWSYWDTGDESHQLRAAVQIDNGVRSDDLRPWVSGSYPSTLLTITQTMQNGMVNFDLHGRYESVPAGDLTVANLPSYAYTSNDHWFGVRLRISEKGWEFYVDMDDSGTWTLAGGGSHASPSTLLNEDLHTIRFYGGHLGATQIRCIYDDVKVYEIRIVEGTEITNIKEIHTVVAENMEGSCQVIVSDHNMANFASLSALKRFEGDVFTNDLLKTRGEFLFARQSISRHEVAFLAIERGRVLQKINAEYNSILADGELTGISDPVITDSEQNFPVTFVGKFLTFTDVEGPSTEIVYPNSDSGYHKEVGGWDDADYIYTHWQALSDPNQNDFGFIVDTFNAEEPSLMQDAAEISFTCPGAGESTGIEIELRCQFNLHSLFQTDDDDQNPVIFIWNENESNWKDTMPGVTGIGEIADWPEETDITTLKINITLNPQDYFVDDKIKIRVYYGTSEETAPVATNFTVLIYYAVCRNTYSLQFAAEGIVYEIDATTSTTLTVTGQTPNADGVAVGDRYKVGDYLHNILFEIWIASAVGTFLNLFCVETAKVDATDWQTSAILPILKLYAKRMGARLWQSVPYRINIQTSFNSTGITLYEEDEVTDHEGKGFEWVPDGSNIISKVKVFGSGVYAAGSQIPYHISYQTDTITDNRISTQEAAKDMVEKELADNLDAKHTLKYTIDYEATKERTWDSSNSFNTIDHLKTINVDFSIGGVQKLSITNGIITKIHSFQAIDGHERLTLYIEDVS